MIYVCIPARDEERTIGPLLWRIRTVLTAPEFRRDFQVLAADDASTDRTHENIDRYRKVLPLEVFRWEKPRGYAKSLEFLLREAVRRSDYPKRDLAVVLQADLTEHPDHLPALVKAVEGGADVVSSASGEEDPLLPAAVRWARRLAPHLARSLYRDGPVSDPLRGFRAYRLVVLRKALREAGDRPLLQGEGWAANVELLKAVAAHARRIEEVPVPMRYDLQTRESRLRTVPTLKGLFRARRGVAW